MTRIWNRIVRYWTQIWKELLIVSSVIWTIWHDHTHWPKRRPIGIRDEYECELCAQRWIVIFGKNGKLLSWEKETD